MPDFNGTEANEPNSTFDPNFYGNGGDDAAAGNAGPNQVYGGAGNDLLLGGAITSFTGAGTSTDPFRYITAAPSGDDIVEGGDGSDVADGGDGDDKIYGGEGNDGGTFTGIFGPTFVVKGGLYGGTGNDYVNGGGGNDEVYGGDGDDNLVGSYGDDQIEGGAGKDNMYGGSDADLFRFLSIAGLNGDRIGDFDRREGDIIDLSAIDAKQGGSDNAFKYIGDDDFTKKGQVSFKNGKLKLNTDNDDGAEAKMLVNTDKLTKGDFDL